jgi:hypothetical protein
MTPLLVFCSLAHDAEGVLATVHRLANVSIKLRVNCFRRVLYSKFSAASDFELLVAIDANPHIWGRPYPFNNSKFSFWDGSIISCL